MPVRNLKLRRLWLALLVACLGSLLVPGAGNAAKRKGLKIEVLGCITGNRDVAERRGCELLPGARSPSSSALAGVVALLRGSEGRSLYTVGNMNSVLTRLALGPPPGRILLGPCFTGNSFIDECVNVPGAKANAHQAPISHPTAAAISPDGRFLYLASGDFHGAAIARFSRDPLSGELAYIDCLTGDRGAGPAGTGACASIPSAVEDGFGSGLDEPSGIAIGADGDDLYVTARLDQSVVRFARDDATGALEFRSCISSNPKATACARAPRNALDGATAPLLSADGRFLYVAARRAGAIATFSVAPGGEISYVECLVEERHARRPCRFWRKESKRGSYTLSTPAKMVESRDGRFLYVSSSGGAIVVLERNELTGRLSVSSCISGFASDRRKCALVPDPSRLATGSPLNGVRTMLLSRNGKTLYLAVRSLDGITRLRRDPRSGALAFAGCVTGDLRQSTAGRGPCAKVPLATRDGVASGFHKTTDLVQGPGNLLYAAASRDSTILALRPR